jgi:CelD/BcsL family acetyltransferase involved in cellulose biosynthesis
MVQAGLFGGSVLGAFNDSSASQIVRQLFRHLRFDMLVLGNLPMGSGLSEALLGGRIGKPRSVTERRAVRRLIILPNSYDEFLRSLKPSTAKAILRDQRLFERLAPIYQVSTKQAEVADFVLHAAAVSSITQKTERGAGGVADTPATRERLRHLAHQGRLRAYLASVEGRPVACAWGDVSNGVFYFRETAYDPAFARYSPGRAMLLYAVTDLIRAGARVFDFGVIDFHYKARLSNHSVPSANVYIARTSSLRGWLALTLQMATDRAKALVDRLGLRR